MKHLPTISQHQPTEDGCVLHFTLDPKLSYFEGHFPGQPILAGVVQLDWAVELARNYLNLATSDINSIEVLKFQRVLPPNTAVELSLIQKDPHKFTFSYQSSEGGHASGRIKLATA